LNTSIANSAKTLQIATWLQLAAHWNIGGSRSWSWGQGQTPKALAESRCQRRQRG